MKWFINIVTFTIVMAILKWVWESIVEDWNNARVNYSKIWKDYYIDVKFFYATKYKTIPNIFYIGEIDSTKVYQYIEASYSKEILNIWQHCYFDMDKNESFFNTTIIELKNKKIIEIGTNHIFLYYEKAGIIWSKDVIANIKEFKKEVEEIVKEKDLVKVIGFAKQVEMN